MKNFFRKIYHSVWLAPLLFVGSTQFAHAGFSDALATAFNNIGYYVIGKIAFGVSYLIAWIAGVAIALDAWLVGVMLSMNEGIFQTEIVQKGFAVTLSIANLGFVLGIIIIALATILQSETYGAKKLLWKLVIAAILVNFSLVIAAPIFNLGNSFTRYFLQCVDPGGGGCNGAGAGVGLAVPNSMNNFASGLAGAFNPQDGFINDAAAGTALTPPDSVSLGQDFGKMLVPIFSIAFVALELLAVAMVMLMLAILLLMRYLWIVFLAILMPFAWLGWVFPSMKGWWSSWWNNFIRWTFFAPAVVFFLYLAMAMTQSMRNGTAIANQNFGAYTSTSNAAWGPLANFFTGAFEPILQNTLNMIVMLGLSVGGIIAADKLGVKAAGAGMGAMTSVGKSVQGFVGKRSKKIGRAAYDRGLKLPDRLGGRQLIPKGATITNRLQSGEIGALKYVPGAKRAASLAGRSIANVSNNQDLVEAAKKNVPKNPEEIRTRLKGSMSMEDQLAHIAKLVELGEYKGDEVVNGKTAQDYLDTNKKGGIIDRYGQGKLASDADKAVLSSIEMREAQKEFTKVADAGEDTTEAMKNLSAATTKFLEKLGKSDVSKANINGILGQGTAMSKTITEGLLASNPELIPSMMAKMNKVTLKGFESEYNDAHENQITRIVNRTDLTEDQKESELDRLNVKFDRFNKALAHNALGFAHDDHHEAPAAPAAAAAPAAGGHH